MKYIFLLLLNVLSIYAGREFIAWVPAEKLAEFIKRRAQIATHLNCSQYSEDEMQKWYGKFNQLWHEVEVTKEIFHHYFTEQVNATVNRQKKIYNALIKALAEDRDNNEIAMAMSREIINDSSEEQQRHPA